MGIQGSTLQQNICGKVDGSFAASVMGFDGIPIETHEARPPDGIEVQSLLVEYSGIVSQVRQAAETLQMGKASEVSSARKGWWPSRGR